MKKILLPLMAVAALLTACDEERYDAPQHQKGVTFTVPDFIDEAGTRVAVTIDNSGANFTWTEGDTLGVFPSNGYQTAFPISGGAGTNTAVFDGADWALRPRASYAAYYPFVPSMQLEKSAITVSYLGQTQDGNGSTAHLGDYDYLAAKYNTVSASGDVNFTLNHLGCLVRFQLTMPEAGTYTNMTLSCEGSMLTTAGKFDLTAATPTLVANSQDASISLALNNIATTEDNQVLTLYMMLPPMDLSSKNLSIKVSGEKEYEATIDGKNMKAGSIYGYSNSMKPLHEYVDLGLPSGTLWATCNIGANAPEEYGGYYAFGEVETKSNYTWETYKWCNGSYQTKYCTSSYYGTVDSKIVLEAADDAAHVNWGGAWRMPTYEEAKELYSLCTKTAYQRNGVAGYLLTGPNGNSIFMPQAGWIRETNLLDGCFYMSSGLSMESNLSILTPYYLLLPERSSINTDWRRAGFPVRAVCRPNEIKATSFSLNQTSLTLTIGGSSESLSAQILPSNASCNKVYWYSSDRSIASVSETGVVTPKGEGSCYITAITMDGTNLNASCEVTVEAPVLMHNGHEYVDLGLPSGTMWATCNIGANTPEEAGGYYAFGEIETKSNYTWETYKWCNGDEDKLTKYCTLERQGTVDNKIVLEATDDAAHVNWGGAWRMPTYEEAKELYSLCTKTAYQRNGVAGYLFTGPNGNSIFMPHVGWVRGTDLLNDFAYMSSGLWLEETAVGGFILFPYYILPSSVAISQDWRYAGFPVRAVLRPNEIKATSFSLNQTTLTLTVGGPSESLSAQILPSNASCNKVYWYSSDRSIASVSETGVVTPKGEGSCYITAITMDGTNLNASCEVMVEAPVLMHNGHEYVDLGLSVKWATCNVGANAPEEYGDYFAWGETEPYYTEGHSQDKPCSNWKSGKSGYNWSNYKYCNGSYDSQTKYCTDSSYGTVDNKTVLESADDAATANWGGSWHMPTMDELNELRSKCTWNWETKNGVNGYNVVGSNGNSIFLPAAGYRSNDGLYYDGSSGYYWSSSLYTSLSNYAYYMGFSSSNVVRGGISRYCGRSVRPVCQ